MIELLITTLAVFGASALVAEYDGPYNVFRDLRSKYPLSPFACTVCISVYIALLFFVVFLLGFAYYLTPLAIVGVVILLERL